MPKFTSDQQQAIDMDNASIIVSAGAGSGKTAVLSERVIRKLKDGVDIDRLLILTFIILFCQFFVVQQAKIGIIL